MTEFSCFRVPMIRGDGSSVLHLAPVGPRSRGIDRGIPDLLAPDDVFELEAVSILHHVFCNCFARIGSDL